MQWLKRAHNVDWNRRRERDPEWQRAKRELKTFVIYVILCFVLGMFIGTLPRQQFSRNSPEFFGFRDGSQ